MTLPPHERLVAYNKALDMVVALVLVARGLPHPWDDLRDQLRRAATSISLNIAEGAGEYRPADKARFYRYARRSRCECSAILDIVERSIQPVPKARVIRSGLQEVNAMLSRLIQVQSRAAEVASDAGPGPSPGPGPGP